MDLIIFYYIISIKQNNDWHVYSGYVFAKDKVSAIAFIEERYSEDVHIIAIERVDVWEGMFL